MQQLIDPRSGPPPYIDTLALKSSDIGAVSQTLAQLFGKTVVSIDEFNAKGDGGGTDNFGPINNAVVAAIQRGTAAGESEKGATVFFPAGMYYTSGTITKPPGYSGKVKFQGVGREASWL